MDFPGKSIMLSHPGAAGLTYAFAGQGASGRLASSRDFFIAAAAPRFGELIN
jgi:hypothetical protein